MAKTTKKTTTKKATTKAQENPEAQQTDPKDTEQQQELTPEQQKKAEQKAQSEEDVKAKTAADSAKSKAKTGHAIYLSRHRNFTAKKHDFTNGRFETSDPKVIAELEAHPAFGTRFIRDDNAA